MTDTIPAFEGHPVASTAVRITGKLVTDDLQGYVLRQDDVVQVLCQYRVIGVHHNVDEKTGELVRVQVLRPTEMALAPIDPSDPSDDGIIRALPPGAYYRSQPAELAAKDEEE